MHSIKMGDDGQMAIITEGELPSDKELKTMAILIRAWQRVQVGTARQMVWDDEENKEAGGGATGSLHQGGCYSDA